MTDDAIPDDDSNLAEQYAGAIGKLALEAWRLEHAVEELGLGIGLAAGPQLARSTRSVREHLDTSGLPPWSSGVTVDQINLWLAGVDDALKVYAELLMAAGRRRDSIPVRISHEEGHVQVPISEYVEHADAMKLLHARSDDLLSGLAMRTRSGGGLYGFENIARSLYASATSADSSDALSPLPDGRTASRTE